VYDFLFQNQSAVTPDNVAEKLQAVVREAGVDGDAFAACVQHGDGRPAVQADMAEARALKVRSTPTFFINGRRLEGALPYDHFQRVMDETLGIKKAEAPVAPTAGGGSPPGTVGAR